MNEEYVAKNNSPDVESAGNIALVLEIVFGLFGVLGIGHSFTNRVGLGIGLLLGWWIYIVMAIFITTITFGFALCLFVPIYIAVPIISGIQARAHARRTKVTGNWGAVAAVGGGGCLLFIVANLGILLALGGLAAIFSSL